VDNNVFIIHKEPKQEIEGQASGVARLTQFHSLKSPRNKIGQKVKK
jgi:hypothetical protein